MKEFFITPQDSDRIVSAVALTRKMRGVALGAQFLDVSQEEIQAKEQRLLAQAESLAVPTARLITSYMGDTNHVSEREGFDDAFVPLNVMYENMPEVSSYGLASTSPFTKMLYHARLIDRYWESFFRFYYGDLNEIRLPLPQLLSRDVGIIAPLSGDYLASVFHREAVTQFIQPRCFDVKPAAIDRATRRAILPTTSENQPVFADKRVIGISVDTVSQGTTASIVFEAARRTYPEKAIYGARQF